MVAVQLRATLCATLLTLLSATAVSGAPFSYLQSRYASFAGFRWVSNLDSLSWYRPYARTGADAAVMYNPPGYRCFWGQYWLMPYATDWRTFDTLWAINLPTLRRYNSEVNNGILQYKILQIAAETNVDARMILAIIMQESSGQLDVRCTGYNNANCGIMQAAPGSRPFDPRSPVASIDTMIRNGVLGTPGSWPIGGPGYAWLFNGADGQAWYNVGGGGRPYHALRAFNSGRVSDWGNLDDTGGVEMSGWGSFAENLSVWVRYSCVPFSEELFQIETSP